MSRLRPIGTPCIGICSTVYGDPLCRGCKRTDQEIIEWNHYAERQKNEIFNRLEQNIIQVMCSKIIIWDKKKLKQKLEKYHVRYREQSDVLCWSYALLQQCFTILKDLKPCGIEKQAAYHVLSVKQLFNLVDEELFLQSLKKNLNP